jgi:PAS domain S-box-containing protein
MADGPIDDLRLRAEARFDKLFAANGMSKDLETGLHDLRVHQIELEMQNDELRRTQEELAASRETYVELFDLAPVGYLTLGDDGRMRSANLTAASLLGVARADLIGARLESFIASTDQDVLYLHRRRLRDGEAPRACELRLLRATGGDAEAEQFWARLEMQRQEPPDEPPVWWVTFADVTDRRLAEEAVSDSERRFHGYFDQSLVGVAVISAEKAWVDANRATCDLLGYSREELSTLTWVDLTHPEDLEADLALFDRIVAGEIDDYRTEKRFVRKDGRVVDVDLSVHCHRDADGTVQYLLKLLSDVTAHRRAEAEIQRLNLELDKTLARTSDLLDRVTTAAKVGGWELDVATGGMSWTAETYRIHEVDPGVHPSLAQTLAFYAPEARAGIEAMIKTAIAVGTPWEYELPMTTAQGRAIWVRGQGFATTDDGEVVALRGTFQDVSAHREAAALEERARLARDLHDSITQALFAAALKAESMTHDEGIPAASAETAGQVHRLTRGALAQMRTLLLELRSESPADVPIDQLLRTVAQATEGRSRIVVDVTRRGEGQPPRELHEVIYRVAQEALNNVARHSGAAHASLQLIVGPARVRLMVYDDGCGFEPGELSVTHFGLRSMRERAAEAGAKLSLVTAPGEGTLVVLDWRDRDGPTPDRSREAG